VEARLCDRIDGKLDAIASDLLGGHLETCAVCAALERSLTALAAELPRFAEIDPGPFFAPRVLAAIAAEDAASRTALGTAAAWWRRAARRPRLPLEIAYSVTLLATVFFGSPGQSLQRVSEQALEVARMAPVASELPEPILAVVRRVESLSFDAASAIRSSRTIAPILARRGKVILLLATEGDVVGISQEWDALENDVERAWKSEGPPARREGRTPGRNPA
jgi:hypothetical protein